MPLTSSIKNNHQQRQQVRFMHYINQFRAQRLLDVEEAKARGAEREEVEDIQLVNKARKVSTSRPMS